VLHVTHDPAQVADADVIIEVRAGQIIVRQSALGQERALAGSGRT
jgi:ABC-type transport system involved in cytochrome bd biosynthesis fused ATPase/permease subunit